MALNYKIAGQAAPAAATDTTMYTVPAATQFVGSTLAVCNRDAAGDPATFRIAVVPSGDSLADQHYIVYDSIIDIRGNKAFTLGLTLATGDKVIVKASSANLSFTLFGSEIS